MALDRLSTVQEDKKFWLVDSRGVSSLKELFSIMKDLPNETFSYHVNETKNDFYNWVKDVYGDKKLADDLLECTTKEAMLFCLKSSLEQTESLVIFNELPKENIMDNIAESRLILNELPKKNVLENVKREQIRKKLVTLLDPSIFKKRTVKTVTIKKRVKNNADLKPKAQNEKFNKAQIKKIKVETPGEMLKKLKEVYKID